MFPLLHKKSAPFEIYHHEGQPHVLIRQPRQESAFARTNRTSGFLVFFDDSSGAPELKIALLPRKDTENDGLRAYVGSNEGVIVEPVDYNRLPRPDRRDIRHAMEHEIDGRMAEEAAEERNTGSTPDALNHVREEVVRDLPLEHNLVGVRVEGDDRKLTQTLRLLNEQQLVTPDSLRGLEAVTQAMQEPGHLDEHALNHRLRELFAEHHVGGETPSASFLG